MTLRLYDTATRSVRDFVPMTPGLAGIYLCGVTVQSSPHIGHLRSAVNYDVLRRWLLHEGLEVTFVRNVTDVDDKILEKAVKEGKPYWAIAYTNRLLLERNYSALNVLPPTYEPLATGHITEMHELIQELIDRGHAYPAASDCGDVYFDVRSFREYGALSGQRPDDMRDAGDAPVRNKRDHRDFALWKGVKADEPRDAYWPSPWGKGRPGWHIECSAMARRYLGDEFDIHGGGLDLTFPHHENEVAQSKAAGLGFARFWVHHALLNLGESKMSKSLGNVIDLDSVVEAGVRPVELRYYLGSAHYRSRIDYTDEALKEAAVAYRRIEGFVHRAAEVVGNGRPKAVPPAFAEAMNDDLNTSAALAIVHDTVREGNSALTAGDEPAIRGALTAVRAMLGVLGIDPLDAAWDGGEGGNDLKPVVDSLVALALEQRASARARKDWAAADSVRDQLKNAGIQVEDTPTGPRWTVGEQH
ncbi:cysteine--tRNA ligase [Actinoplanes derwentensis]|uniref:Cysteine--tRNA ligase n=1 Tax=Actinoplanes derwentensis TaxID=113562 RepID=A0A1H2CYI2_9ACTN|nr:cysteine--tRNA ligase [Actinoplanes derwentensis]GID82958.1 cysteine--tRNA ligase [Actinoplanes derwentensis]SDT75568.1 cysteinyl-tRNA synthetase [Actinoplanes derwentensis]